MRWTQLKASCHHQSCSSIFLSLASGFYSKGTLNYPDHCQDTDDNEDILFTKHYLPTLRPDRVGFSLSRTCRVLVLNLGCSLESPESCTPDKSHHKLRDETQILVLDKGLQVSPMSGKQRTVP